MDDGFRDRFCADPRDIVIDSERSVVFNDDGDRSCHFNLAMTTVLAVISQFLLSFSILLVFFVSGVDADSVRIPKRRVNASFV